MLYLTFVSFWKLLYGVGFFLSKRVEATLDAYRSGTKAAQDYSSHLTMKVIAWLWWIIGLRRD